jgi:hypothetical protein
MRRRQNPWEAQVHDPELASGLLDVTNRTELEDFLRSLVDGQLPASAGRKLVDVLATTAVRTVPTLHALVGAGSPPAPRVYGLALEGMSAEDRDYELARQFVRLARAAADRVARNPGNVANAVEQAAREFAPELAHPAGPVGKETRMFETEAQPAQYEEAEYGRRRRRRRSRFDEDEYQGGGYGEMPYEAEDGRYGEAMYEAENGGYGESQYEAENAYESNGYGEAEYDEAEYDEAEEEERFLPLIPLAAKALGGLLGSRLMREEESEYDEAEEEGEADEAEEEFLGKLLKKVLGPQGESDEMAMSPAQEAQFAGEFMEIQSEEELDHFLGKIVDYVGKAVQGVRRAARSPQGRALIEAAKPLARAALPALGGMIGGAIAPGIGSQVGQTIGTAASTLFETESSMLSEEEAEFEAARQFVRLASGAARNVACAPPGASPRMVGDLALIQEFRRRGGPRFRRRIRRTVSPFARRYFGPRGFRRRGFRPGFRPGFRRFPVRGPRFGLRPRFGFGFPVPVDEPEPAPEPPGPPAPGFRWVAVPIGAPDPVPADAPVEAPPSPEPAPAASEYEYSGNGHGQGQGGRWVRRNGKIVVLGA